MKLGKKPARSGAAAGAPARPKRREVSWYGWRPDHPDHRDHLFAAPRAKALPAKVDLRAHCPPVMDQGALGSCTAHGITALLRFLRKKQGLPDMPLSRLQIYYDERVVERTVSEDAGAKIRDGMKCAAKLGVGPEKDWPYRIKKFAQKPPAKVYQDALANQALEYKRVGRTVTEIKSALAAGFPVVIGISVYDSFESDAVAKTGVIPMPGPHEEMLGGHCMYLWGYGNHDKDHADGRNSWADDWGDKGDFHIPWDYLTTRGLASDFWTARVLG